MMYSFFKPLFDLTERFGEVYMAVIISFFNAVFRRPLLFILRSLRRAVRLFFRGIVILFAPSDADSSLYADEVTRAAKKCAKVFFSHPGSFPSVVLYYIKKALGRYDFGIKTLYLWLIPAICAGIVLSCFGIISQRSLALEISCGGEVIGYARNEEAYLLAKDKAEELLNFSEKSKLPEVTYSLGFIDSTDFTDSTLLCERLIEKADKDAVNACAVYQDGKLLAVLHSENDAREVLNSILSEKAADEENYTVSFAQTIEYVQVLYPRDDIVSKQEFRKKLQTGDAFVTDYTAKAGDTPESVAYSFGMTKERLLELNALDESTALFEAGTCLKVESYNSVLTFKEVKTEVTSEEVDFDEIEIRSAALYSGSSKVLSQGKKGYDQVTSFVTYIDGKKVSSEEFSRLTVADAVPQRVQIGTKPLDEAYSNSMGGIFLWPIVGAYGVNSDYGYRWGKLHAGIDLGMGGAAGSSLGKNIVAVAPGVVTVASVHSSYGYYVIIDHGNGLQTLYAHCLAGSHMVEAGQVVAAGQPIARVGSTGYSTGPHLHFEVRVNGNRVNPRPYLGI